MTDFDPRDRYDNRPMTMVQNRVRFMVRSGGYVMVRKPGAMPFVVSEKDWAKLPLLADRPEAAP